MALHFHMYKGQKRARAAHASIRHQALISALVFYIAIIRHRYMRERKISPARDEIFVDLVDSSPSDVRITI